MTPTTADLQKYARIVLYMIAGGLIKSGIMSSDPGLTEAFVGLGMAALNLGWTVYGGRIQAKVNELAGIKIQTPAGETNLVETMKVNSVAVAIAAPDNVTPTAKAAP